MRFVWGDLMQNRGRNEGQLPELSMEDAHRILEALGPMPGAALAAMVDYGLSDLEIGRYFNFPRDAITTLRRHWGIADDPP